jgi:iron complex outermembrane receptor protein
VTSPETCPATAVEDSVPEIIDEVRIQELEEALPETRWNLMANHNLEDWRFMARYSDYDDW